MVLLFILPPPFPHHPFLRPLLSAFRFSPRPPSFRCRLPPRLPSRLPSLSFPPTLPLPPSGPPFFPSPFSPPRHPHLHPLCPLRPPRLRLPPSSSVFLSPFLFLSQRLASSALSPSLPSSSRTLFSGRCIACTTYYFLFLVSLFLCHCVGLTCLLFSLHSHSLSRFRHAQHSSAPSVEGPARSIGDSTPCILSTSNRASSSAGITSRMASNSAFFFSSSAFFFASSSAFFFASSSRAFRSASAFAFSSSSIFSNSASSTASASARTFSASARCRSASIQASPGGDQGLFLFSGSRC